MLLFSVIARGQDSENAFEEAFEDMFQYEEPVWIPENTPAPHPFPSMEALLPYWPQVAPSPTRSTDRPRHN